MLFIIAKDCGDLTVPISGAVTYNGTTFGFEAYYSCEESYSFRNASRLTSKRICGADGRWTGLEPICITSKYQFTFILLAFYSILH